MDSKMRFKAILLAFMALICVGVLVAALNPNQTAQMVNRIAGEEIFLVAGSVSDDSEETAPVVENGFVQDVLDENGMIIGSDLSAFMRDETFFDPERPSYAKLLEQRQEHTLSLMATSVEKDLRVQVVDELGRRVVGESFYVMLQDKNGQVVTGTGTVQSTSTDSNETSSDSDETSSDSDETSSDSDEDADGTIEDKNLAAFDPDKRSSGAASLQEGTGEENGSYKDLDQDGIIYIGGLKAGDYTLTLQPVEGYQVAAALPVSVKDKLEYRIIDDISALIKTEDEIDVAKEDTKENEAGKDVDGTESTAFKQVEGNVRAGIDVSKWNGDIDWARVKAAGVDFAIIRCGYRGSSSGVLVEDPRFWENIREAKKNNISVGVYFFTQAVTEVEAVEEASMVVSLCRDYELDYPVFIDTEGAGGNGRADGLNVQQRTAVCRAFCETIESAGLDAGVYASRNWWYHNITASELSSYVTWLAEYRSEPIYTGKYQIWQYTSNGSVDGMNGRVDLNISYLGR